MAAGRTPLLTCDARGRGSKPECFFSRDTPVVSDTDAALNWLAGVWYSHSRVSEETWTSAGSVDFDRSTVTEQEQVAAFGQVTYRLTQRLTANAGVRLGSSHYDSVTYLPSTARAEGTNTSVTPRTWE